MSKKGFDAQCSQNLLTLFSLEHVTGLVFHGTDFGNAKTQSSQPHVNAALLQ